MDLSFTDEQEFLRDAVRGVVEREGPLSRVRDWVLGEHVDHGPAHALAVRQGWTGIGIPEEAGGQGGGMLELAILAEELGRGAVPADALYGTLLAALALSRCSDERAGAHVEALAAGEASGALARPGDSPADAPPADGALQLVLGAPGATLLVGWDGQALEVHDAAAAQVTPRRLVDRTSSVADKALFLHGAVGYTWEHDLQLLFKRAKSDAELFGGAGVYDDRIADALELVPAASLAGASD